MTDLTPQKEAALAAIEETDSLDALDAERVAALGKKGWVSLALKSLGGMSPDQRQQAAPAIQAVRSAIADAIESKKATLEAAALEAQLANETIDLTLPAPVMPVGTIHPVSQVMDELAEIFADLGFAVATGPEIEDDWHNFTALNMDESHPARAMHDTFYFPDTAPDGGDAASSSEAAGQKRMLLRTHTSPVQIRTMKEIAAANPGGAPVRIIAPGRVYRSDSDATHTPMFHQVEGLVIDEGIHLGHLKWTLETFLKAFFEREDIVLRLRPSYFPFTEPSVEVDVGYANENGRRVVGGHGDDEGHDWMELLGSGMVNRRVLEMGGFDPDRWQGFAWGLGVDRLAMLKYGMDDLRAFFDGDPRWLAHYGFSPFDQPTLSAGVGARA
ncbi:phenylalanine--tRNA ligase subunit alpha [Erythrobacter sp. JK5]|uniref:phenylalanine--tRNA ligase subunit alpha n=1 Tax=Erythrobacter sp. JK5 TaxID=2829500 RepID=UPI001BA8D204|nr:phenylalanine--tRNA ligase subunit alpha [Erythrobacter sp. JK5]QUL37467.1 phenylalanine--tRNA ligase subunit alpha [Erythrobacter sp. JK5]